MVILETKRLLLRELEPEDRKDLAEILQDPQVMYAYEHEFTDDDVQAWLDRQLERYRCFFIDCALWRELHRRVENQ